MSYRDHMAHGMRAQGGIMLRMAWARTQGSYGAWHGRANNRWETGWARERGAMQTRGVQQESAPRAERGARHGDNS